MNTDLNKQAMIDEINRLRIEKDAVIVAHTYQIGDVQDIADLVGDSYALAKFCAEQEKSMIVFCGVDFMAESAKILAPDKTVLLPERQAGCPMAQMVNADGLRKLKAKHPDALVVTYINSSAEVKAESDVIVTSSNAVKVVRALNAKKIIFAPDKNLGSYVAKQIPDVEVILWDGFCPTHHRIKPDEVARIKAVHPDALLLIHPECTPEVLQYADFVGSTKEIIEYATKSDHKKFIIGTEMGVLHPLMRDNPEKTFYLMAPGLVCPNMKKTTLESVLKCLQTGYYEMNVPQDVAAKARKALDRMLELSK
ncbi:MAG: quinolinate synthase NadA [Clostridiaceae bacterium]|nr:quinolinate synthase NadA [Clostridiaceae bacterium]